MNVFMTEKNQRKMLFLYPNELKTDDLKNIRSIMRLSPDLKEIVNSVNHFIKQISEKIGETQCPSKIQCTSVSNYEKVVTEYHNIRLCLVQHNDIKYNNIYNKIIDAYKHNSSDISHLISLSITSHKYKLGEKTKWKYDPQKDFDINIETHLNYLEYILSSIMLDIIFYRYFKLSNNLSERKKFSKEKKDYILNLKYNDNKIIQKYYGSNITELNKTSYLSLSYPLVLEHCCNNSISLDDLIHFLLEDYWNLIIKTLFVEIELLENYTMFDPNNQYSKFDKTVRMQISDVIPAFCKQNNVDFPSLVAIKKGSVELSDCYFVEDSSVFLALNGSFNYFKLISK